SEPRSERDGRSSRQGRQDSRRYSRTPRIEEVVRGIFVLVTADDLLTAPVSVICSPVRQAMYQPIPVSKGTANLAKLCFGKRLQCLGRNVSKSSRGQSELRTGFISGKFRDQNCVIVSHRQVPSVNLSTFFFRCFPGGIKSRWAVLYL